MQHQLMTEALTTGVLTTGGLTTKALTTEELVLGLDRLAAEDPKMGSTGLLWVATQAALAMGLCGIVNIIAG